MGYGRAAWAEIDLTAVRRNMARIKTLIKPETRFCAVIKADGYGHGAAAVGKEAVLAGADYLAVAVLSEAIELREHGFTLPILVLGYTPPELAPLVAGNNLTQTVYTLEQARALARAASNQGRTVKAHVKIDTGMSRIGIPPEDCLAFCQSLKQMGGLELEGVFTHFAQADSRDKTSAQAQFSKFTKALAALSTAGVNVPIKHAANSAATLDMPETHLDMVRPGIILYGLWPSDETGKPIELEAAMKLKARLSLVKQLPAGQAISYGGTYKTTEQTIIGTLPLGYADGYTRLLSGKAAVVVRGRRAPVIGRICMDQCMVNLNGVEGVAEGTEALLFGGPELPVEELAAHLGTINYELVTMIGKRVPRLYAG